ncbi:MAG: hypothetical protein NWQ27_05045 [Crocinitomicaceae bacterium]|nr:hypothetical protein [Crocinitomicaceae bacterium]
MASCSGNDKVIASVNDSELRENDAFILMRHAGLNFDSIADKNEFVDQWIENEVFKAEMKELYPEEWKLIQLRASNYSGDLAKFYLEENELKKQLDTIVSMNEITEYYNSHKDEFVLHDYIVKAMYLKIPKGIDFKAKNIQQKYLLKNDKDIIEVNSYAKLYAVNFYYNDSAWVYFNELTKDIPLTKYNTDNIVLNRTKTYFSDDDYTYFLNIIDFNLKDEAPPVDFLQNEIKSIIVANRLQILKEKNESKLIQRIKKKYEISHL